MANDEAGDKGILEKGRSRRQQYVMLAYRGNPVVDAATAQAVANTARTGQFERNRITRVTTAY